MASEKNQSTVVENGVTIGVIVLALFVIFAVGLPRWIDQDDEGAVAQSKIVLPDRLSGGYAAADLASSWSSIKGLTGSDGKPLDAKKQAQGVGQGFDRANKSLGKALSGAATTRAYIKGSTNGGFQVLNVQAFRATGGAFAPEDLGVGSSTVSKVGDGVCSTTPQVDQSTGQSASDVTCQRSGDGLTIQVNGTNMTGDDLMKYADELHDKLS